MLSHLISWPCKVILLFQTVAFLLCSLFTLIRCAWVFAKYMLMVRLNYWLVDPNFTAWPLTLLLPLPPLSCGLVVWPECVCLVPAFVCQRLLMGITILSNDSVKLNFNDFWAESCIEKNKLNLEKITREHTCAYILAHLLMNAVS